jgi:HSP20 family protein
MLIRWTPYSDFANIFQSFDNLARQNTGRTDENLPAEASNDTQDLASWSTPAGFPAVESFKRDDNLILRAELPGINPADIKMTVEDGRLVLSGEKKQTRQEKDSDHFLNEVSYGRFQRSFRLPRGVRAEQLKARHENGILTVTIPVRSLEDVSRRVPIQIGSEQQATEKTPETANTAGVTDTARSA